MHFTTVEPWSLVNVIAGTFSLLNISKDGYLILVSEGNELLEHFLLSQWTSRESWEVDFVAQLLLF